MTMAEFVRQNAEMDLAEKYGAERAHHMMEGTEVHAIPTAWVEQYDSRIIIEWRETESSPLSWVVMLSEEQDRTLAR